MSIAKMVEAEFNMAAIELTTAPKIAASTKPLMPRPMGSNSRISVGKALS